MATGLDPRLLVAGGGGGAAFAGGREGGCCGDAGHQGTGNGLGAGGDGAGTLSARGVGGAGQAADPDFEITAGETGLNGSSGAGGAGGQGAVATESGEFPAGYGGGGGGGGYYGGGGASGGNGDDINVEVVVAGRASWSSQRRTPLSRSTRPGPSMTITYTIPPPAVPTKTAVAGSPNPALQFQTVTFTASINSTPAGGTVAFDDGNAAITGCSAVTLIGATATCQTTTLGAGPHSIAVYSGTTGDAGPTSTPVSETVIADTPANLAQLTLQDVQAPRSTATPQLRPPALGSRLADQPRRTMGVSEGIHCEHISQVDGGSGRPRLGHRQRVAGSRQ